MDKNLNINYNYYIIINYKLFMTVSLKILCTSFSNKHVSTMRYSRRILALKTSLVKKENTTKILGLWLLFAVFGCL